MIAYILAPILAFISSVVFVIPFEVALLVLAGLDKVPVHMFGKSLDIAKYGTTFPWLLPFVAALGSNAGSIVYYFMGKGAVRINEKLKQKMDSFDMDRFAKASYGFIIVSSLTSIPPVSVVAVAAGFIRMKFANYFTVSFFGKVVRYYLVIILGRFAIDLALRWLT